MKNKLLIVDDEPHITKALKRELRQWSEKQNIIILTTNQPQEVPDLVRVDKEIFLILTDMMMPLLNGSDLVKEVKEINNQISAIIMTGYSHIDLVVTAVRSGISSLIIKPWNIELLIIELDNALERFRFKEKEKEYIELIEEELKWGGELQKQLLKRDIPENPEVNFFVHYEPLPSLYCGGDYYDIIPLPDNRYFIISADVSGHGIKAAFITTILKSIIFSRYIREHLHDLNPANFLKWLNLRLLEELISCPDILITASVVLLDVEEQTITYSNAGHTPLYIQQNDKIHEIINEGPALNFIKKVEFKNKKIHLINNDRIFFLTDGLLEIGQNNQMLDKNTINSILLNVHREADCAEHLSELCKGESVINKFSDDITVIIVELL